MYYTRRRRDSQIQVKLVKVNNRGAMNSHGFDREKAEYNGNEINKKELITPLL